MTDVGPCFRPGSDVEEIFRKGEEGMKNAEGFIKQMEIGKTYTQVRPFSFSLP